jgi:predicted nucleic acid-binding protein
MGVSARRVVWDAASWVALIIDEKIRDATGIVTEDRGALARGVQRAAERGQIEIVTPALALVETCGSKMIRGGAVSADKVEAYFDHDYVYVAPLDTQLAKVAREVVAQRLARSLPYCRPCDATYLATAIDYNIPELHTFDGPLSKLDRQFSTRDGRPIVICRPDINLAGTALFGGGA